MKAKDRYKGIRILGTLIVVDNDNETVTFPDGTAEGEIQKIAYYLLEEGFLD